MDPNYLNFQMGSSSDFVSMAPYIYHPQNLYYLPQQDSTSNPSNFFPIVSNQVQPNLINPILINDQQQQQYQQSMIYSVSSSANNTNPAAAPTTTTNSTTSAATSTTTTNTSSATQQPQSLQTTKPMPAENDPFFIPIQGIVPPSKNADGRYECNICNRTYTHAKHLKRHTMRHTGQKPYECSYCSAKFTRPDIRTRHALKCRLSKLKESNGGTLPENLQNSVLSSKSSKGASVKKNSHPATSAATKAIFKCAPQIPSAITAMNRAKNVAAAAAAASLASNILNFNAQTKVSSAVPTVSVQQASTSLPSSANVSPSSNSVVLSPKNYTPQQQTSTFVPTPELKPSLDYPTPVSMDASPSSNNDKLHQTGENLPGYITPVEPQLSVFSQHVSQTALVDPELCRVDPVSMDQLYTNINTMNPVNPVAPMASTNDVLSNAYCIYNGGYNANQNLMMNNMNGMGINNINMGVPMNNINGLVSESQPMLFPVNGLSSNMKWQNYA